MQQQIGTIQALERGFDPLRCYQIGEALHPTRLQPKDIVGKPDVIGSHHLL